MLDRRAATRLQIGDALRGARIAVLEDEDTLRDDILVPGLAAFGFEVEGFARSAALYRRLLLTSFDAVVLDVGLPDEDGLSVARHLRAGSPIGIVMLTGCGDRGAQLRALGETVDAWLAKPVDIPVIAATIGSLLRRMNMPDGAPAGRIESPIQDVEAATGTWRLVAGQWKLLAPSGRSVDLSRAERCIMQRLFAANGEPVSREALIAELGEPLDAFDPHRLEMLIHRLRRKAADALDDVLPIRSVRNRGYVLTA